MLASSSPDVAEASPTSGWPRWSGSSTGCASRSTPGDDVAVFTRNLNDITDRLPEVVAVVRALPADRFVLDGEALTLTDEDRPQPSRT